MPVSTRPQRIRKIEQTYAKNPNVFGVKCSFIASIILIFQNVFMSRALVGLTLSSCDAAVQRIFDFVIEIAIEIWKKFVFERG